MQHFGRGVHDGYRRLSGAGSLSRKPEKDLQGDSRRSRDRRRHRSPHRRTDPIGAGQHPRGRKAPDSEYHPADGHRRGHLRRGAGTKPRRAAHPAPSLPRHRKRQAGRRLRRHRQVFRRRSGLDTAGHVPADTAHRLPVDSLHALDRSDDGQPVRHLRHLLHHHVVCRSGSPHGAPKTRNERREDHGAVDPRNHRSQRELRSRRQGQTYRRRSRVGIRQGGAHPPQALRRSARIPDSSWRPAR